MKKQLILFLLTISMVCEISAINIYFQGDTLIVWAEGGLSIRDTNSISGKRLGVIPYGEKVIVKSTKVFRYGEEKIKLTSAFQEEETKYLGLSLYGKWVKVIYGDIEGFVFDGYLSKNSAPLLKENGPSEDLQKYILREFGLLRQKDTQGSHAMYYGSGVSFFNLGTTGSAYVRYILPEFSQEEIMLFIKNSRMTNENGAPKIYENKFIKDNNIRTMKFVYDIGNMTIKVLSGMVILEIYAES